MDSKTKSFSNPEPFKATQIWNSLVGHLKSCLEPKKRRWKLQTFENCFRGLEVAEELQNYVYSHPEIASDPSKVHVKSLCQFLLENRVIECVCVDLRKDGFDNSRLYRFVCSRCHSDEGTSDQASVNSKSDLSKSCEKSDRKKKRRSLDGWGLHSKSSRRKSYHGFIRREKFIGSSPVIVESNCEKENESVSLEQGNRKRRLNFNEEEASSSAVEADLWVGQIPSCRKSRRSLGSFIRKPKSTVKEEEEEVPTTCHKNVWFQVSLSNLLKLIDAPFLERTLRSLEMKTSLSATVLNNSYNELQTSLSSEDGYGMKKKGGRRSKDSVWQQAALECFAAQNRFPLPREECGFQNIMSLSEAAIFNSIADFYCSLSDSLIPANYSDLVDGILELFADKSKQNRVTRSLQLLVILVPQDQQEHLKRLLSYLEKSLSIHAGIPGKNRLKLVCRKLMDGILPERSADQSSVDGLISLMIKEHDNLFSTPMEIREQVKHHLQSLERGIGEPAVFMSACQRLTPSEYEQQMVALTREELRKLMTSVIEDLSLNLRAKEQKLNQFKRHHVEIFMEQFPAGQI